MRISSSSFVPSNGSVVFQTNGPKSFENHVPPNPCYNAGELDVSSQSFRDLGFQLLKRVDMSAAERHHVRFQSGLRYVAFTPSSRMNDPTTTCEYRSASGGTSTAHIDMPSYATGKLHICCHWGNLFALFEPRYASKVCRLIVLGTQFAKKAAFSVTLWF
jgi:hypothetical protein